jgi:hypothetical protein
MRRAPLALLPVLLAACSISVEITASFDGGRLTLHSEQERGKHWCARELTITERETGRTMWAIVRTVDAADPHGCADDFPIAYGALPRWAKAKITPHRLVSGRTYDIEGDSGSRLYGAFRYEIIERVTNVRAD